jgi:MarR family transcriptional regulator for hemolysin
MVLAKQFWCALRGGRKVNARLCRLRNDPRAYLNPARTFGFLLNDTSRLYTQRFEQRADALGLTLRQCKVLVYLAEQEGISQVKLAEFTDLEAMTVLRTVDGLEFHGLLERCNDPTDRRARRLYLKAKGQTARG